MRLLWNAAPLIVCSDKDIDESLLEEDEEAEDYGKENVDLDEDDFRGFATKKSRATAKKSKSKVVGEPCRMYGTIALLYSCLQPAPPATTAPVAGPSKAQPTTRNLLFSAYIL